MSTGDRTRAGLLLAGVAASVAAFPALGQEGATAGGRAAVANPAARAALLLFLPATAALVLGLLRRVAARDPWRENYDRFRPTHELILTAAVVFVLGLHATVLGSLLGWPVGHVPGVTLGLLLLAVGNVLPRVRPNLSVGVRTPATLAEEAAWSRTHRLTGYVLVVLGLVVLAVEALVPASRGVVIALAMALAAVAVLGVSWARSRRAPSSEQSR